MISSLRRMEVICQEESEWSSGQFDFIKEIQQRVQAAQVNCLVSKPLDESSSQKAVSAVVDTALTKTQVVKQT